MGNKGSNQTTGNKGAKTDQSSHSTGLGSNQQRNQGQQDSTSAKNSQGEKKQNQK